MADTTNLALPFIDAAQSQKHVTHNEALAALDVCVQLAVLARGVAAPPAAPVAGARYIVDAGAAGAFAGRANQVASWDAAGWRFLVPRAGWLAWSAADDGLFLFDGAAWTRFDGKISTLQNLQRLGVGTGADATDVLAVKTNSALFTARGAGEGGSGDLRFKLNKEAAGKSLSQLYQSNWSGRAETGLMGDDRFRIKVSADGAAWRDALEIDPLTGAALVRAGAAAAPGLAFMGDQDTGLMRPAAKALALVAGGVERARVDANGLAAPTIAARLYRLTADAIVANAAAAFTLTAAENGATLRFTSASAVTLTVAAGLGAGFSCAIVQSGTGVITLAPAVGVVLGHPQNMFRTAGRHARVELLAVAANELVVSGALVV